MDEKNEPRVVDNNEPVSEPVLSEEPSKKKRKGKKQKINVLCII